MLRNLVSVGGFTLLSRIGGFLSAAVQSAVMGAGEVSDAFFIAQRLPNSFRAIFGEGAFNAAYVPSYSQALEQEGPAAAKDFASQIFTLLLASQVLLLALAWAFTPQLVMLIAPGLAEKPGEFGLAVTMTRIVFPYLLFITLFTLHQGTLNAHGHFALAAFAPVLMNVCVIVALLLAFLFPNAGVAASVGFVFSGALQLALLMWLAHRLGLLERLAPVRLERVREFLWRFGPAIIGSAAPQIALFADTILSSLLPVGGVSAISYAERLYQLPNGLIGVAAGTVLLPEMSRRLAAGDTAGAQDAQNRAFALTIAAAMPFVVAFLTIPELIVAAVFMHGKFTMDETYACADVLSAYAPAVLPLVLVASARAGFQSRGDTKTPMLIAFAALAVNVALKVVLIRYFGAPGLATATAVGFWINVVALVGLALSRGLLHFEPLLWRVLAATAGASLALFVATVILRRPALDVGLPFGALANIVALTLLGVVGAAAYIGVFYLLARALGVDLSRLRR